MSGRGEKVAIVVLTAIIVFLLHAWFVQLLWNGLAPVLGVPTLTFWQAVASKMLVSFLSDTKVSYKV